MIIEPDFLDHWKTRMLTELTGEPTAPLAVIRLWAHCQQRRAWEFRDMGKDTLKAVCRWNGDATMFFNSMKASGFIEVRRRTVIAHDWAEVNRSLVTAWDNGRYGHLGKRPVNKGESDNPPGSRRVAAGHPIEKTDQTEKTDQIEKTEKTDQTDGNEPADLPAVSEKDLNSSSVLLADLTAIEAVRFVSTGNKKQKASSSTLEELAVTLPEATIRAACAKVYSAKLQGRARNPAGMLTTLLRSGGNGNEGGLQSLAKNLFHRADKQPALINTWHDPNPDQAMRKAF